MDDGILPPVGAPRARRNLAYWRKRLFFKEQEGIKALILERGRYGDRDLEVYERFFRWIPNRLAYLKYRYDLGHKKVLDVGCNRGQFLVHFGEGSMGLDGDEGRVAFVNSMGMTAIRCNFEESLPVEDGSFDVVWCSNVLEHVLSPHLLLRRMHRKLRPGGLLITAVPTVPSSRLMEKLVRLTIGSVGYRNMEHVNGFTKRTLEFAPEQAQFDILESGVFGTTSRWMNALLQPVLSAVTSQAVVVARKSTTRERTLTYAPTWAAEDVWWKH